MQWCNILHVVFTYTYKSMWPYTLSQSQSQSSFLLPNTGYTIDYTVQKYGINTMTEKKMVIQIYLVLNQW